MNDLQNMLPVHCILHYVYCPRRFYLEYIENLNEINEYMQSGMNFHNKSSEQRNRARSTKSGRRIEVHEMVVESCYLNIYGKADIIILNKDKYGNVEHIVLKERKNFSGNHKVTKETLCQIAGYIMCLEYMYPNTPISVEFYSYTKRKSIPVEITEEIRDLTKKAIDGCNEILKTQVIPKQKFKSSKCNKCSFKEHCHPKLRSSNAQSWFEKQLKIKLGEMENG